MMADAAPARFAEVVLLRRWLDLRNLRVHFPVMPVTPSFPRLIQAGSAGIAWMDRCDEWTRQGFRGPPPIDFEAYVATEHAREVSEHAQSFQRNDGEVAHSQDTGVSVKCRGA